MLFLLPQVTPGGIIRRLIITFLIPYMKKGHIGKRNNQRKESISFPLGKQILKKQDDAIDAVAVKSKILLAACR